MLTAPPLLALAFASPWLLGGLALGAVPIVIHLLYKRRYREVPWAAMRFLIEASRKNARRLRLEQLILLAVRVLILLLVALALASPYVESFGSFFAAGAPVHRIVLLDASYSMEFQEAGSSRFERARSMAREIASGASQGDALNLVRISGLPPRAIVAEPSFNRGSVVEEIDRLQPTHEKGDLPAALEEAVQIVRKAPDLRQKELYIISDFQRGMWAESRLPQIRELVAELSERARLVLLDVSHDQAGNFAITSFSAEEPFVTTGGPVQLQAAVRNFGGVSEAEQTLELHVGGRLAGRQQITVPPGGEARAVFTHTFGSGGEYRLEARIAGDGLDPDNHRWLALPVRDELRVLLVDGRPAGRPSESATFYLRTVLAPEGRSSSAAGVIRPHVISDGELPGTDLSRYDCVFLCNVGLLTDREAQLLTAYVGGGGGLVICLGDQVRPDNYNQALLKDGKGPLPAGLGERRGSARDPQDAFLFDPGDLSHPIVNQFKGNPGTGLEATLAFAYMEATLPQETSAEVVLRFDTGDPAIVDAPFGRGRVILFTTSVDQSWGPWPLQASFPPIMHETVRHAVAGRWTERQKAVGEPFARSFPLRAYDLAATVKRPDGGEQPVAVTAEGAALTDKQGASLAYGETDRAGVYELRLGSPLNREELFAVNVDPAESDLAGIGERELRGDVLPDSEFLYRTEWHPLPSETAAAGERSALSRWLLCAVIALVFVELLMAWRFASGLLLLSVVLAAAFAAQAFSISSLLGAALAVALAAALLCGGVFLRRRGALSAN
jgi:hypothetical protein